ncbi:MAG: hypothetical protein ABI557_15475 [Aureliella sp.]
MSGKVLFTEPCEAIFNTHEHVHRSALVGIGPIGEQTPIVVVEPWPEHTPADTLAAERLIVQLRALAKSQSTTESIEKLLIYPKVLPTDIRHNSKIFREQLGLWAARQLEQRKQRK